MNNKKGITAFAKFLAVVGSVAVVALLFFTFFMAAPKTAFAESMTTLNSVMNDPDAAADVFDTRTPNGETIAMLIAQGEFIKAGAFADTTIKELFGGSAKYELIVEDNQLIEKGKLIPIAASDTKPKNPFTYVFTVPRPDKTTTKVIFNVEQ